MFIIMLWRIFIILFLILSMRYLPRDKKFTWEFIDQCASFPSGAHDDMVDSMSQALARLIHKRTFRQTMRQARRGDFNIPKRINKAKSIGKGDKIHVI